MGFASLFKGAKVWLVWQCHHPNTRMLKDQVAAGHIKPPMNIFSLSYFMIRLAESCLCSDIIAGREPREAELEDACTAVRILLGGKA